jgi:2'-hydroxyisoflavone reductase
MLTSFTLHSRSSPYSIAMNLLVIGGTRFVGRHLVEEALRRGHEVTLFNRGKNASVFPNVAQLHGDRDKDVSALEGKSFDAVIDTCGYIPRHLQMTAEVLKDVPLYVFISTISVYADPLPVHADENAPLAKLEQPTEEVTNETYGALKVLCENVVKEAFPNRALVVRPGFIVGPYDPTDRFSYYPYRVAKGGEMLAPPANTPMQFIDARDLAAWTIKATEQKLTGTFNIVTPADAMTFGQVLETAKAVSKVDTKITYVDDAFISAHEEAQVLPMYVPEEYHAWGRVSSQRAINAGLTFRRLEETIKDTLEWLHTRPENYEWKAGLKEEREKELLQAWHQRST